VGNRTIGRYQTIAKVDGSFDYVTLTNSPLYTQYISSLASPNLQWETTTGINLGLDFGFGEVVHGSIDYYNNNTTNLLYEVDIPSIGRFDKFPDNLGKLNNRGIEMKINTVNLKRSDFEWLSTFNFTRNRNTLKELLGFDLDSDGKEDDLISEGLFIGESLSAIYDYKIDGFWQVGDDIPSGYDIGSYRVLDLTGEGILNPDDRIIVGYRDPSYMFSIMNSIRYKEWTLMLFINSIQGGKNYYLGEDIFDFGTTPANTHFRRVFPEEVDFWVPENPTDAWYERPGRQVSPGLAGKRYSSRSFIRLQDVSLSYDLPANIVQRFNINNLRVYLNGKNLLTISNWKGFDPETGVAMEEYGRPVTKSLSIGVNLDF
jgi:TonB-dependent starch-binding outer membrane protein SusC